MNAVHVIGAGLAGLAAALTAARAGRKVTLWEAAPRAGGRCRSRFDAALGAVIDDGTHLALSGNRSLARYLALIGAADRMTTFNSAALPFLDTATGARWTLRPGAAMLWRSDARPPGVSACDLLGDAAALLRAGPAVTVAQVLGNSRAFAPLWRPLTVSALNAPAEAAAATLLAAVCRETLLRGGAACRPMLARISLDDALTAPALAALTAAGAEIRLSARVEGLVFARDRVTGLRVGGGDVVLAADDAVIVAVAPWAAARLFPGMTPPAGPPPGPAIINAHFRGDFGLPPLLGLTGGRVDWLFQRPGVLSATVSAADDLAALPAAEIAALVWREAGVAAGTAAGAALPAWRVFKERRATVSATPAAQSLRPTVRTAWRNLFFAGDGTAQGLPSSMEGAVRSGFIAGAACGKA